MIKEYQSELAKGNLMPNRAAEILSELSALIGNIGEEITRTEMLYNKFLLKCYDEEKTANRAKILAGTSKEFEEMRTARNTKEVCLEMMRGLKYLLRAKEEERRESSY
jgi:hypothetical protein